MCDPFTDLEINCRSQLSLLEACRHHAPNVKVLFASTRQIYGRVPADELPVSEQRAPNPVDVGPLSRDLRQPGFDRRQTGARVVEDAGVLLLLACHGDPERTQVRPVTRAGGEAAVERRRTGLQTQAAVQHVSEIHTPLRCKSDATSRARSR